MTRVLPAIDGDTEFFWTSGRDGQLRIQQCVFCDYFIHPPAPACPACGSLEVAPKVVSGRGWVWSATINQHAWVADEEGVYVVALVELVEQPGLRLATNVIGCEPESVTIGRPVQVVFEDHDPVFLPLFEPRAPGGDEEV